MKQVIVGMQKAYPTLENEITQIAKNTFLNEEVEVQFLYENELVDFLFDMDDSLNGKFNNVNLIIVVEDPRVTDMPLWKAVEKFRRTRREVASIFIVPDFLYDSDEIRNMFNLGLFDVLFMSDFSKDNLTDLILFPRSKEAAREIYGIKLLDEMKRLDENNTLHSIGKERTIQASFGYIRVFTVKASEAKEFLNMDIDADPAFATFLRDTEMDLFRTPYAQIEEKVFPILSATTRQNLKIVKDYFESEKGRGFSESYHNGVISKAQYVSEIKSVITNMKDIRDKDKREVLEAYISDVLGYGELDAPLADNEVSDIRLLSADSVFVQAKGKWYRSNIMFENNNEFSNYIGKICTKNDANLNRREANAVFTDVEGCPSARLRFICSHPIINSSGLPSCHIRKIFKVKKSSDELIGEGLFTRVEANFLQSAVKGGKSVLIGGASGSGKTVCLNWLLESLPDDSCGFCCQESDELFSDTKPNIEWQHSTVATGDADVEHDLHEIAKANLLKNAKVAILGEVKGDEAGDVFNAANNGAQFFATVHARNIFGILVRMTDLILRVDSRSQTEIFKILTDLTDIVVFMENYRVKEIARVVGWDTVNMEPVYEVLEFVSTVH